MKLKVILLFTIVLAGCQPQPKNEQHRHTVCQSLIEGYLKMTNQQDYKWSTALMTRPVRFLIMNINVIAQMKLLW